MSVYLGITKTVAISSLGLYAGILTSTTLITTTTPVSIMLSHTKDASDDSITKYVKSIICNIGKASTILSGLATGFFGLSYFFSPSSLRHPYLIYGMLVAPASIGYLYVASRCAHYHHCKKQSVTDEEKKASPSPAASLSDSTVDLGKDFKHPKIDAKDSSAKCPFGTASTSNNEAAKKHCNSSMLTHLSVVTVFTIAGFVQSVLGVYGEGQFA